MLVDWAGDDQRCAGFIDQNGVHLVYDGVVQFALNHVLQLKFHIVPQVIESKFIVRSVCDVTAVRLLPFTVVEPMHDDPDRKTQEMINLTHPGRIAFGQVIVHRNDIDAFALQRVEINRKSRCQGFPFPGLHFSDLPLMQNDPTD